METTVLPLLEETRRRLLSMPEIPFLTAVRTKSGRLYFFPGSDGVFSGDYTCQETAIGALLSEEAGAVDVIFSIFQPRTPHGGTLQPEPPCGYFLQRLAQILPENRNARLLLWGGRTEDGQEDIYHLKSLKYALPPK